MSLVKYSKVSRGGRNVRAHFLARIIDVRKTNALKCKEKICLKLELGNCEKT